MIGRKGSLRAGPFRDLLPADQEPFTVHQESPTWNTIDREPFVRLRMHGRDPEGKLVRNNTI